MHIMFLVAIAGHLLCGVCDCLMTYVPGGKKFDFKQMSDNAAMKETFEKMPLRNVTLAMVLGCVALFMCAGGYFSLYQWMKEYSSTYSIIMLIGMAMFLVFGSAHHVLCGVAEWIYIRMGMTEEARGVVIKLFKDTSLTMVLCYIGLAMFAVTFFIAVVTGATSLPAWACVFNTIPPFLVLTPFRIGGAGNWSGAFMFAGLMFLM